MILLQDSHIGLYKKLADTVNAGGLHQQLLPSDVVGSFRNGSSEGEEAGERDMVGNCWELFPVEESDVGAADAVGQGQEVGTVVHACGQPERTNVVELAGHLEPPEEHLEGNEAWCMVGEVVETEYSEIQEQLQQSAFLQEDCL